MREARLLSHYYVASDHFLLGLLADHEGLSCSVSLLQTDPQRLAQAAQAARPRRLRFGLTHEPMLVAFARTIIERQAAMEAGDYARAKKLHNTTRWVASTGPRPSIE